LQLINKIKVFFNSLIKSIINISLSYLIKVFKEFIPFLCSRLKKVITFFKEDFSIPIEILLALGVGAIFYNLGMDYILGYLTVSIFAFIIIFLLFIKSSPTYILKPVNVHEREVKVELFNGSGFIGLYIKPNCVSIIVACFILNLILLIYFLPKLNEDKDFKDIKSTFISRQRAKDLTIIEDNFANGDLINIDYIRNLNNIIKSLKNVKGELAEKEKFDNLLSKYKYISWNNSEKKIYDSLEEILKNYEILSQKSEIDIEKLNKNLREINKNDIVAKNIFFQDFQEGCDKDFSKTLLSIVKYSNTILDITDESNI
jgi:cell fate (sporulation/competence/biofilm development) regulator YlbF (YheA/YmcA/DUF963 family)